MAGITFDVRFDPVSANWLTKLRGMNTLYEFTPAPDLLLKQVTTMQEAIDCGGVMIIASVNGQPRWQFLAGDVLHRALSRAGLQGLLQVEHVHHVSRVRFPTGWRLETPGYSYSVKRVAIDELPVRKLQYKTRFNLATQDILVMGLVTKGHGRGMGPVAPNAGTGLERSASTEIPANLDIRGYSQGQAYADSYVPTAAQHQYALSTRVRLSTDIRAYLMANKDQIIANWKERGSPGDDVMAYFEKTYEKAVVSAFPIAEPLDVYFSYVGQGSSGAKTVGVTGPLYYREPGEVKLFAGPDGVAVLTSEEAARGGIYAWADLGMTSACAGACLRGPISGTGVDSLPDKIKFGTMVFKQRDLLGACLPKLAINFNAQPGVIDYESIIDVITGMRTIDSAYVGTASTVADAEAADAYANSVRRTGRADTDGFLGPYMGQMLHFGTIWDTEARAAAKG